VEQEPEKDAFYHDYSLICKTNPSPKKFLKGL